MSELKTKLMTQNVESEDERKKRLEKEKTENSSKGYNPMKD